MQGSVQSQVIAGAKGDGVSNTRRLHSQLPRACARAADHFQWNGLRFEIVDLDGKRIDKVLVNQVRSAQLYRRQQR